MTPEDLKKRKNTYWAMQDIEKKLAEVIMRIADMVFKRMTLEKAILPDECWPPVYEERRQRLYNLSKNDCLSKRWARKWLENYGGSPQRKKRGIEMLDTAIEH